MVIFYTQTNFRATSGAPEGVGGGKFSGATTLGVADENADEPAIKSQEYHLSLAQKLRLYLIRYLHYSIVFFMWLYPCVAIVRFNTDVAIFALFLILEMHRRYFGECILSILDKKMLEPSYKSGSNPKYEPFAALVGITPELNNTFTGFSFTLLVLRLLYGGLQNYQY